MPCNLSAFVLGFVLKEYCRGEYRYRYGDDSKELNVDKLKDMVKTAMDAALDYSKGQTRKQNEYYIVKRTNEERAFDAATSKIFGVDADGRPMETVRGLVCGKMKDFSSPCGQ